MRLQVATDGVSMRAPLSHAVGADVDKLAAALDTARCGSAADDIDATRRAAAVLATLAALAPDRVAPHARRLAAALHHRDCQTASSAAGALRALSRTHGDDVMPHVADLVRAVSAAAAEPEREASATIAAGALVQMMMSAHVRHGHELVRIVPAMVGAGAALPADTQHALYSAVMALIREPPFEAPQAQLIVSLMHQHMGACAERMAIVLRELVLTACDDDAGSDDELVGHEDEARLHVLQPHLGALVEMASCGSEGTERMCAHLRRLLRAVAVVPEQAHTLQSLVPVLVARLAEPEPAASRAAAALVALSRHQGAPAYELLPYVTELMEALMAPAAGSNGARVARCAVAELLDLVCYRHDDGPEELAPHTAALLTALGHAEGDMRCATHLWSVLGHPELEFATQQATTVAMARLVRLGGLEERQRALEQATRDMQQAALAMACAASQATASLARCFLPPPRFNEPWGG